MKSIGEFEMTRLTIILTIIIASASIANGADTEVKGTAHHPHPVHATSKRLRHPVNTASKIIHHPVHETSSFFHEATGTISHHPKPE
jgi:hypothetical protein